MATTLHSPTKAPEDTAGEAVAALLRRDRLLILSGLTLITALAWVYLLYLARGMPGMSDMEMGMAMEMAGPQIQPWGMADLVLLIAMWVVMMVAMMTPSTAPMILTFAGISRRRREGLRPYVPTGVFVLGYLLVWAGFSVLAALAQWGLHATALLSPMMMSTSPVLGGALLIAAGIFQWTPLKHACLRRCRSPMGFILHEWREGTWGALVMGLRHGAYCVGCCWLLMGLLFVAGVMNLLWVAIIAGFVLVEKLAPAGHWVGKIGGLLLLAWGGWLVAGGF